MPLFHVECASRDDGSPYTVACMAQSPAEAMAKVSAQRGLTLKEPPSTYRFEVRCLLPFQAVKTEVKWRIPNLRRVERKKRRNGMEFPPSI